MKKTPFPSPTTCILHPLGGGGKESIMRQESFDIRKLNQQVYVKYKHTNGQAVSCRVFQVL